MFVSKIFIRKLYLPYQLDYVQSLQILIAHSEPIKFLAQ